MPALRSSSHVRSGLERATDPRHFSAVSETPIPTSRFGRTEAKHEGQTVEGAPEDELAAVLAAVSSSNGSAESATPEDAKNDLDLPAFMRRERRLFQ